MAEFAFFGIWEDSKTILEQLIEIDKFIFILDRWYEEPKPEILKVLTEDEKSTLERMRSIYLYSADYSIFPPFFPDDSSEDLFRIFPLQSGPAIKLTIPFLDIDKEGMNTLGLGLLIYQSKYWHPETLEYYSPPQTLKDAFKLVKKIISQHCERRFIPFHGFTAEGKEIHRVRTLYISKCGMELVRRGDAYVYVGRNGYLTDKDLAKNRQDVDLSVE